MISIVLTVLIINHNPYNYVFIVNENDENNGTQIEHNYSDGQLGSNDLLIYINIEVLTIVLVNMWTVVVYRRLPKFYIFLK